MSRLEKLKEKLRWVKGKYDHDFQSGNSFVTDLLDQADEVISIQNMIIDELENTLEGFTNSLGRGEVG